MIDRGRHPAADRVLEEQVIGSFEQSEKNMEEFFKDFDWVERKNIFGQLIGFDAVALLEMNRFNLTVEKIVRGLFFVESGCALADIYAVFVHDGNGAWSKRFVHDTILQMGEVKDFGDDVFHWRFVRWAGDKNVTAWILLFYGAIGIFALTAPR
jgi:hypothetical protein